MRSSSFSFVHDFLVHASAHDIQNKRMHFDDFEQMKILGRGAFGTVDLVRRKNTGQVYAMKTLSKFEMVQTTISTVRARTFFSSLFS